MIIAILGVDGAGKTTLAKNLAKNIKSAKYIYAGYNEYNRKYLFFDKFIKSPNDFIIKKIIIRLLIITNDLIEFHYKKDLQIKIYDRYIYDNIVQNYKSKRQSFYTKLSVLFPKPDLLIFLGGDENIIFNRKKELTPLILKEQTTEYRRVFKELSINYIEFDSTKLNQDEILQKAIDTYENK